MNIGACEREKTDCCASATVTQKRAAIKKYQELELGNYLLRDGKDSVHAEETQYSVAAFGDAVGCFVVGVCLLSYQEVFDQ